MTGRREMGLSANAARQRVRRYPRDELLCGIGRRASQEAGARYPNTGTDDGKLALVRQGYLLLLAGICVTRCNNHRRTRVTDRAVDGLVNDLFNVWDSGPDAPESTNALQRSLSRTSYVQMPFQNEPWPPLMRTLCLYGDDPRFGPPAITKTQWHEIVGVSVEQFLQIGFLMFVAAMQNGGAIDRTVFDPQRFDQIVPPLTTAEVLETADLWLSKPVADLTALGRANSRDKSDLWGFNPFFEYPIALLENGTYVMPSPLGVLQRLSPQGVFFIVRDATETGEKSSQIGMTLRHFSDALGKRFERYVGEQLTLLQHITLHPEITYDRGQKKSVDYIVETPEAIVLVEVKSTPPDIATRSGIDLDSGKMGQMLTKACSQITRSAEMIEQGHPKFPNRAGRPMRGLILTREQFYNLPLAFIGNTKLTAKVPTSVWSSQQLEHAIPTLINDPGCGARLLESLASATDRLQTTTEPLTPTLNPLLSDLWEQWGNTWPGNTNHDDVNPDAR